MSSFHVRNEAGAGFVALRKGQATATCLRPNPAYGALWLLHVNVGRCTRWGDVNDAHKEQVTRKVVNGELAPPFTPRSCADLCSARPW